MYIQKSFNLPILFFTNSDSFREIRITVLVYDCRGCQTVYEYDSTVYV